MPLRHYVEPVSDLLDARTFLREHEPSTLDVMLDPDDPQSFASWHDEALALARAFRLPTAQQGGWILTSDIVWMLVFR
jgi:hypothetical protein